MRARSKNFNFSKAAPTKVEDMVQGEWRMNENGLYGRVGNQILTKAWPAYYGIFDEFDDQSLDPKWDTQLNNGATYEEAADGTLTINFSGAQSASCKGDVYQDPVGALPDGLIPAGVAFSIQVRFQIKPLPYTADQTDHGDNVIHYDMFEWSLWDDQIYWDFYFAWCYGATPGGYDMFGLESAYWGTMAVDDEYNSTYLEFSTAAMVAAGRAEDTLVGLPDYTHNGWFTFKFSKSAAGVLKFELQPDGSESWLDVTPSGLTVYDLDIGGKNSYEWGWDVVGKEYCGGSYVGSGGGPVKIDWVRP